MAMLQVRPNLQALNIGFNKLNNSMLASLCTHLASSQLEVLVLSGCRLDQSSLPHLSTLIQQTQRLKSLNLDSNLLSEQPSSKLAMLSPTMCRRLSSEGAPLGELAQATYTSRSLCFLSLRHNGLLNEEHLVQIEKRCAENRSNMQEDLSNSAAQLGVATCGDWMRKPSSTTTK